MEPTAELIRFPKGYGTPKKKLAWHAVRTRLAEAEQYWLATTRPDGRPHVVPVDGVWVDDRWYFGGADQTVHQRNLRTNQQIAVHLADPMAVVIAEGTAEWCTPDAEEARRVAEVSNAKYGYGTKAEDYRAGVWSLRPTVVLAWDQLGVDATRFVF